MIIDLRKLTEHAGQLTADETVSWVDASGAKVPVQCHTELDYQFNAGAYYCHGELSGHFHTVCHRCLEPSEQDVKGEFDLVVRKSGSREPEADVDPDVDQARAEGFITLALTEHEVSLDEIIYENLVVSIPMQIVCTPECKGLCPTCGMNLNTGTCQCARVADPRWEALNKLKRNVSE